MARCRLFVVVFFFFSSPFAFPAYEFIERGRHRGRDGGWLYEAGACEGVSARQTRDIYWKSSRAACGVGGVWI